MRKGVSNGPPNGIVNPGYATPPASITYFFSDRGAYRLDNISATDLGVNWYLRTLRTVRPFVEVDLLNIFNQQGIEDPDFIDRTVTTRKQSACLQAGSSSRCLASIRSRIRR